MHGAQILPFLGAPFERFDLFRVGWGGARVSRTVPVCAGWHGCFAGSPYAAPSCSPLTRRMLLLSRPPSRETCLLPPRVRWRTFRVVPRGASAFASRRWACPASPSTRLLPCASVSRRGTLLIWLGFRMRPAPASLSSRPRRGRNSGIMSFTAENMAL